jgi:hypothetical protein
MAISDWLAKRPAKGSPRVMLDVVALQDRFAVEVPQLEGRPVEPELVRARLADGYRDLGLAPMAPERFDAAAAGMDDEAWRRLALAVTALRQEDVRAGLPLLLDGQGVAEQVKAGFVAPARELSLLTMELLRQSELRVEEFARQFIARLGAGVIGETPQHSRVRLHALDYARLLEEAEKAKVSAEQRMEYIRRLQEMQDRRSRRGKW